MESKPLKVMIVAGEASGDAHAARLVRALRNLRPEGGFEFFGAVSHALRQEGVEEIVDADHFSIMGLPEIARALPMFWRAFRQLRAAADKRRPDVAVLVDFPEFNLKLAKSLRKLGIRVVYYISPQLWAWRRYRVRSIRRDVDLLLAILPFEKAWYAERGVEHVEFVGNPMIREVRANATRDEFRTRHGIDVAQPLVALLAGSRSKEMSRIMPPLLETAAIIHAERPEVGFVVPLAASRTLAEFDSAVAEARGRGLVLPEIKAVKGETYDAVAASDAAAVASGTATLETAILGTPLAVVYKASGFNYKIIRPLIDVAHFGLVNLIAEERLAREFIQDDFTPRALASELLRLLEPAVNGAMRTQLAGVAAKLGEGGASDRAAAAIMRLLEKQ